MENTMIVFDKIKLLDNPIEENKQKFIDFVNSIEYDDYIWYYRD